VPVPQTHAAGSPEWWRERLVAKLNERQLKVQRMEAYYGGEHPLPSPPTKIHPNAYAEAVRAHRTLARMGVTNWVKLVADAPAERLQVIGFRFGDATKGDDKVWRTWQANHLDADSALVQDNALQTGNSAVIVWGDSDGEPVITPEHSSQVIVAYEAGSRRRRAAALKLWVDDDGRWLATLYLPDAVYKWRTRSVRPAYGSAMDVLSWDERQVDGEDWPLPNPLGEVPVVEFRANASLRPAPYGGGAAEFELVLPIQDRINKTVFDRLVTAESQAFRQRWAIGWDPPRDESGLPDPAKMMKAAQALLWTFDADPSELQVGEFAATDFSPFLKSVESDVAAMAAISQTPPYYLLGKMENIAAEGLIASEAGLIGKTRKHAVQFGESWEEVMRLALKVQGDSRADDRSSMILWADIEQRTWSQTVDALLKMQTLGVPTEELWSRLPNTTPQDVARWRSMVALEGLLNDDDDDEPEPDVDPDAAA
jgi:hypothetical protein